MTDAHGKPGTVLTAPRPARRSKRTTTSTAVMPVRQSRALAGPVGPAADERDEIETLAMIEAGQTIRRVIRTGAQDVDTWIALGRAVDRLREIHAADDLGPDDDDYPTEPDLPIDRLTRAATPVEIVTQVARLLMSYPNGAKLEDGFGERLTEEALALAPSIGALAMACRKLCRTSTFVPSIKEFYDAVGEARKVLAEGSEIVSAKSALLRVAEPRLAEIERQLRARVANARALASPGKSDGAGK